MNGIAVTCLGKMLEIVKNFVEHLAEWALDAAIQTLSQRLEVPNTTENSSKEIGVYGLKSRW